MQQKDNECFERSFEACMFSSLLASLPLLWPFVFSHSLLFSLSLSLLLAPHQWLCNERRIWGRRDETLLGGGHPGVPGELSINSVCACLRMWDRYIAIELPLYVSSWLFIFCCLEFCLINMLGQVISLSLHHTLAHILRFSFSCCVLPLLSIIWCYQLAWLLASVVCPSLLHWTLRWLRGSWPLQGLLPGARSIHTYAHITPSAHQSKIFYDLRQTKTQWLNWYTQ